MDITVMGRRLVWVLDVGFWPVVGQREKKKTKGKGNGKGKGRSWVSEVKKDQNKERKEPEEEAREVGEVKAEPESFVGALMMLSGRSGSEGSAVKSPEHSGRLETQVSEADLSRRL